MPGQDYTQFENEAVAAGAPVLTVNVPTYGKVWFFEKSRPGPMVSYTAKTMRAERQFVVWPYERAWGFCAWQIGWSYLRLEHELATNLGDYVGAGVFRQPPQPLPIFNRRISRPLAWATEISRVTGLRPSGVSEYTEFDGLHYAGDFYAAEVSVVYCSLPYRVLPDDSVPPHPDTNDPDEASLYRYVNRIGAPSAKHVQFPSGSQKWEGVGLPKNIPVSTEVKVVSTQTGGRMIPHTDISYTWYQVPGIPKSIFGFYVGADLVGPAIGKVNSQAFDIYGPEELLLTAVDLTPHRMVTGERAFDITYRFRHLTGNNPDPFNSGDVPLDAAYAFADSGHNYFLRYYRPTGTDTIRFVWDRPFTGPDVQNFAGEKKWVFDSLNYGWLFKGPFTTGLWTIN